MKNFGDNFRRFFDLNIFGDRFQNALTFFIINRFGRDFFKSCVDFHGGHDGTGFRVIGAFIGDITEYNWPSKNIPFFFSKNDTPPVPASDPDSCVDSHSYYRNSYSNWFLTKSSAKQRFLDVGKENFSFYGKHTY